MDTGQEDISTFVVFGEHCGGFTLLNIEIGALLPCEGLGFDLAIGIEVFELVRPSKGSYNRLDRTVVVEEHFFDAGIAQIAPHWVRRRSEERRVGKATREVG